MHLKQILFMALLLIMVISSCNNRKTRKIFPGAFLKLKVFSQKIF